LIQAADDTVAPPEQSDLMAKALRAGSKSVTLIKIPGDDHWLSNGQTRLQALTEVDNFLRSNLPP
jgi:dipeptidyl aminopeptidase/acylaminoacyl peptidase